MGARLCSANARSIHLASLNLRRVGRNREAILLVATAVEEAAKAGLLHRAWLLRGDAETYARVIEAWNKIKWKHEAKHKATPFMGGSVLVPALAVGLGADLFRKLFGRTGGESMLAQIFEALLGDPPETPGSWYDRLWDERQAIFVDWEAGAWSNLDQRTAGAFYDEGQPEVRRLFRDLRRDLRLQLHEGTSGQPQEANA
jgi:hypothetical protein